MDIILDLLGTAGLPTTFVGTSIFFIFLYHKQQTLAKEGLIQDYQRIMEDNRNLRQENEKKDDEIRDLNERLLRAEAFVEVEKLKAELRSKHGQ